MKTLTVLAVILLIAAPESEAHIVAPDGSGDFPTIQAALDSLPAGSTIELSDGTFQGVGNRDLEFHGKAITLRSLGSDPTACVVDLEGTLSEPHRLVWFAQNEGLDTVIEGLTIMHGYDGWGGAIRLSVGTTPTIARCVFIDNAASFAGGAVGGDGVPTIISCTFYRNRAPEGGTLSFEDWGGAILENTIIAFSPEGQAIHYAATGSLSLTCCDIYGNAGGDWVGAIAGDLGINGNVCLDPLFCGPETLDLHLHSDSPCAPFTPPNQECDLVGALPVGCGSTMDNGASWGAIKAQFRR